MQPDNNLNQNNQDSIPEELKINSESSKPNYKKSIVVALALIILLALGTAALIPKSHKQVNPPTTKSASTSKTQPAQINITSDSFSPTVIKVKVGQSVTWTNTDSKYHEIASDPYPANSSLPTLRSQSLDKGQSYTYTFEKSGKVTYHDQLNPYKVKGTVIVE